MAVYGGSIQQLASNEMQDVAMKRAASERALMNLIRAFDQRNANQMQARALQQRDAAMAQQGAQFDRQMSANNAHEARMDRYNLANLALQRDRFTADNETRRQNISADAGAAKERSQEAELRALLPTFKTAAEMGDIDTITELAKSRPFLSTFAPSFLAQAAQVRKEGEQNFKLNQADADLINDGPAQVAALKHMVEMENKTSWNPLNERDPSNRWNPNRWFMDRRDNNAISEWSAEAARIPAARAAVMSDRPRMGNLQADPSGRYSAVPPPWRTSGTAPVVAAPTNDGSGPTLGEIRRGFQYIGGDPSTQESWLKLQ